MSIMESLPAILNTSAESKISNFYAGQNILVTGATGFVGKILVEKLLRSCPDVDTVFLLIRSKKNENIIERTDQLLSGQVFKRLSKADIAKIVPIHGDITLPGLGLSPESRKLLADRISIVFHSAATVRFNDPLRLTLKTNLRGTQEIMRLSKEMKNLKVLVYVSTAYSNCPRSTIDEVVYDTPMSPEQILNCVEWMSDEQMESIAPYIMGNWPNSYSFSKALAENLVRNGCGDVPVAIYRPSIVVNAFKEPLEGWNDNFNGPSGIAAGSAMGVIRCFNCDEEKRVDLIPVDYAVNGMIAAGWDVATNRRSTTVFNLTSGARNPITWRQYESEVVKFGLTMPPSKGLWAYYFLNVKSPLLFKIAAFFLHTLPALFLDILAVFMGKRRRMMKLYTKVNEMAKLAAWFAVREWNFSDKNVQGTLSRMTEHDRQEFLCDLGTMCWSDYLKSYYKGLRKYTLKDDESNVPEALVRYQKLVYIHRGLQFILSISAIAITSKLGLFLYHLAA